MINFFITKVKKLSSDCHLKVDSVGDRQGTKRPSHLHSEYLPKQVRLTEVDQLLS